jgi:putative peptidoglycan lipid II flippase
MIPLKHAGLALATSISAMINLTLLTWFLRRKIGPLGLRSVVRKMLKPILATAVMGLFCLALVLYFGDVQATPTMVRLKIVLAGVFGGGVIYFVLARIMGAEELGFILGAAGLSRSGDLGQEEI